MISLLIVSKDRPCQLDLFLRSILKNFLVPYNATVLYTYSNDSYKKGYDIVLDLYQDKFNFVKETNFKQNVLASLNPNDKYFTSLGDDVVVFDEIGLTKEFDIFDNDDSILALNYRMGRNIDIVFQGRDPEIHPKFVGDNLWNWVTSTSKNWHYSMALMGQFYRMSDIINYFPTLSFSNPNSLEGSMVRNPFSHRPLMLSFDSSKMIELALNRVQTVALTNKKGNISTEFLNEIWLSGKRLRAEPIYALPDNINRYYTVNLEYEDRK